jgi:hypothetical protein
MKNRRGTFDPEGLTISYKELGTISIEEQIHALVEDGKALKEIYNVQFVKAARIRFFVTNEYGEIIKVRRPGGGYIHYMETHHYRPACLDYDL